jgi:PKD repeat protein
VVLALLPGWVSAAPTATFIAHRGTAGGNNPAPLYVHFDATATQSSFSDDDPFVDLLYEWDFGDPQSGNWGTNGLPKNRAFGGVSAHVYEKPGTYTITLKVTDRAGASTSTTRTVVVTDPDQFWNGKTACVSATGNFTGCPTSGAALLTSADFDAAMNNRVAAGYRRILFRRGETFDSSEMWSTPPGATEALVSAFGTGAKPRIRILSSSTGFSAIDLKGTNVNTPGTSGWRFVDLQITSDATNVAGVSMGFVVDEVLLDRMDIGPTGIAPNFIPDQSPLTRAHKYVAMVDTELRGNTGTPVSNTGTCWIGGADYLFISGVNCGQANQWQMRISYTNMAVISNNNIKEVAGGFEAVKFHCSLGPLAAAPGVICKHMVFSDNVLAKTRLNIANGGNDNGTIRFSVFERNVVNGSFENENPDDIVRYNVAHDYTFKPRSLDDSQPRRNYLYNNVCMTSSGLRCVNINTGVKIDGLRIRNMLYLALGASPSELIGNGGTGTIDEAGSFITRTSPFVAATPNFLVRSDFALKAGSTLIDKGVAVKSRTLDLLGNVTPQGSAPDVGAIESGGSIAIDGPPAPPVLLSVDVQP